MKNIVKKIGALVLVWVVCLATLSPAFAASASLPSLPSGQCVVDEANVLSSSTVQTITDLNAQLQSSCKGATIGVLTVDYTGNLTTEDYALQAFNTWGIGSSSENNGVLILLVMESQEYEDGDYYLTYGDGFRNTTLESQASALAQTMEDDFVRQDYDDAVTTCARNVAQTIADIYGVSKVQLGTDYLRRTGIDPAHCVMIGDTQHDAEVAAAIGAKCVLYTGGHQSRALLEAACPHVIDDLALLPDLLESL